MLTFFAVTLVNLIISCYTYLKQDFVDFDKEEMFPFSTYILFIYAFNIPQLLIATTVLYVKDSRD